MLDCVTVTLVNRVPNSVTVSTGVSGGGTWGTISGTITDQSDLVTYVADEIASIPAPSTPTLQSVTDAGNTTTNAISTGTVTANNELHLVNSQMRIFRSSDDMRIRTGNSDRMTITSTGDVGIGTTAPEYKLDVYGTDSSDAINTNVAFNISRVVKPDLTNTTATLVAGTELPLANMHYSITYYNAIGETERGGYVSILPTSGNQRVQLDNLPISPDPSVIGRKIYRNKSTDSSSYGALIATISDNTTTSYLDSLPESDPVFSGHIFSRSIWALANTTTNFVSVDDVRSMVVDPNLTVFGYNAGQSITRAGSSTLIGSESGKNITYGSGNTLVGYRAGLGITTGAQNVLIGDNAGSQNLATGGYNIALGPNTLKSNGSHNIAMGYYTGQSLGSGSGNILLGSYIAQGSAVNFNDSVIIGRFASSINGTNGQVNINNLIFGNKNTQVVGIGTSNPAVTLDVDGQVHLGPQTATGFPSIDIASNGRTTIRASAPALSVRDSNNNGGYIDMGGGTLANINSITSAATLLFSSTNVRYGGDTGARVNVVGQNSSSQYVLGLKQGSSGSNILLSAQDSTGAQVIGITADGGFYARDSNLIKRYVFDHDYAPTASDGLSIGLDFRTENASGVLQSLGYIDVTQDDISADESSMRFSVGELNPTEVMRLQSDGNVGIGSATPSSALSINGTALAQFRLETKGAPSSVSDTNGSEGDFAFDDNYLYIKTANGWGRTQLDFGW